MKKIPGKRREAELLEKIYSDVVKKQEEKKRREVEAERKRRLKPFKEAGINYFAIGAQLRCNERTRHRR